MFPAQKLVRKLQLELQPGVDALIAKYASVSRPAVRVLSIQKHIREHSAGKGRLTVHE